MKIKISKNGRKKSLDFLDNIPVDLNLKNNGTVTSYDIEFGSPLYVQDGSLNLVSSSTNTPISNIWLGVGNVEESDFEYDNSVGRKVGRISKWFSSKFDKIKKFFTKKDGSKAFKIILANKEQLSSVKDRIEQIGIMIEDAKKNGQTALYEKLKKHYKVLCLEEVLLTSNFNRFISEKKMIEFVEGYKEILSFTYLKNFTNPIPKDVLEKKNKAQALNIFDNFIILHHDPNLENESKTEEEIKRDKDPIIFGLIKESRNFYFVGDWIDEYCDLTFDKMVKKFSEKQLTLAKSVNTRIQSKA